MSSNFTDFLLSDDLNLDGLKQLLEQDSSYVNKVNFDNETPLLQVLKNKKCSAEIVQLLLHYNANVNSRNSLRNNSLLVALQHSADESIIKILLENGADINCRDCMCRSPVCVAFYFSASRNVIKLLLDAGCRPNACWSHGSLMHCALDRPLKVLTEDFLADLIYVGGDLNSVDSLGRSPLCLALLLELDTQAIDRLLNKGASLDACKRHASPMVCATNLPFGPTLRTDVVELLLEKEVSMVDKNDDGLTPLQSALVCSRYEIGAIKLLLDHPDIDAKCPSPEHGGNLLHLAVSNPHCKLHTVKALIDRGIPVDEVNNKAQTPLHIALIGFTDNVRLKPGIIEVLLKNGSPVNAECDIGTPMILALMNYPDCYILKVLFAAGASVDLFNNRQKTYLLKFTLDNYKSRPSPEKLDCLKMLLKCSFLENPDFYIQNCREDTEFLTFADDCVQELDRMESQNVGYSHTLREFVCECHFPQNIAVDCDSKFNYDLNQLLKILADNVFPIYYDIILAKIGRVFMKEKFEEVHVYTLKNDPGFPCVEKYLVLDYESVCYVTQYLNDKDIMQLILAFFNHSPF